MNIKESLKLSNVVVVAFLTILILTSTYFIRQIQLEVRQLTEVEEPLEQATLEMEINVGESARAILHFVRDLHSHSIDEFDDSVRDFERYAEQYKRLVETEEERILGRKVFDIYDQFILLGVEIRYFAQEQYGQLQRFREDVEDIRILIDEKLQPSIQGTPVETLTKFRASLEMEINIDQAFAAIESYILEPNAKYLLQIVDAEAEFERSETEYRNTPLSNLEKQLLVSIESKFVRAVATGNTIIEVTQALNENLITLDEYLFEIDFILDDQIQNLIVEETKRAANQARASGVIAITTISILGLAILLVTITVNIRVSGAIINGVNQLITGVSEFARGNLDYRIKIQKNNEFAHLAEYFNEMIVNRQDFEASLEEKEVQLRRAQKMDAIGQLTGGIAHDFNNILGIIIGNLSFLERELAQDKKALKRVKVAAKAAHRAANLTKQLLGFSRKQAHLVQPTVISQLIRGMESLIARSLTPEVEIEFHFTDELWFTAIDPGDFEDAFLNLILNARDSMPKGGKLTIEASNKVLDAEYARANLPIESGEYVNLVISDSGIGISKKDLEHVLEPFYTTKEIGKGTGLGLSMVFGFVQRSNGHIKIYSEPGIGTAVNIYLPRVISDAEEQILSTGDKSSPPRGRETILIVDDEEDLARLAQDCLENLGYTVVVTMTGPQALKVLAERPIDLLFSDVIMPGGMSGYDLVKQAANLYPGLKFLLTSGYTNKSLDRNGRTQFNKNLLNKPYSQDELASNVRFVLDE